MPHMDIATKAPAVPHAPLMSRFIPDISYDSVASRFSRPQRTPAKVVYELTRDPGYLFQYYRLRAEMFISVWGLEHFNGQKDAYDDSSDVVVARIGNHVIGGCRVTFKAPHGNDPLPMEKSDFSLAEKFPHLPLAECIHVEISRMAILPDYQNSVVMLELSRQLLKLGIEKHARYAFTLSPAPLARNYRKAAMLFGLKWNILNNIAIPDREEYEGIKMVLSMLDLDTINDRKSTLPLTQEISPEMAGQLLGTE
jgi:hypothetical protein